MKTSIENLTNIRKKLAGDIEEKMRSVNLSENVITAESVFRTYNDGDYSVSVRVVHYTDNGCNLVDVTCYSYDDYDTNKSKATFFLNQMEAFFAYMKKMSNDSKK